MYTRTCTHTHTHAHRYWLVHGKLLQGLRMWRHNNPAQVGGWLGGCVDVVREATGKHNNSRPPIAVPPRLPTVYHLLS